MAVLIEVVTFAGVVQVGSCQRWMLETRGSRDLRADLETMDCLIHRSGQSLKHLCICKIQTESEMSTGAHIYTD